MLKKIVIVACLMALPMLIACGEKNEPAPTQTVKPTTKESTVNSEKPTVIPTVIPTEKPSEQPKISDTVKATVFAELEGEVSAGIIFDNNKIMYVAKNEELLKITPDGKVSTFCSFKDLPKGLDYYFTSPLIWDMTFDKDGNILAAAQDRIFKITPKGKVTTLIREDFKGFLGASGIECDKQGNMYITNGNTIDKYSPKLEKTTFIDGADKGYTSFFSLEFDSEGKNLYVTDFFTKSLLKYEIDSEGKASNTPTEIVKEPIKNSGDYGAPLNITFSENDNMYVSIDGMNQILKMDTSGKIEFLVLGEEAISNHIIAFGGKGFDEESFYITTYEGKKVYEYKVGEKAKK